MRLVLLSLFLSLFIGTIASAQLAPQQVAPLYQHLYAINKEWAQQPDLDLEVLRQMVAFENDEQRIQKHLQIVEKTLRSRKAYLSPSQLENRMANLDNLIAYWQRNRFPKNTGHEGRQPYFIDQYGTACAVGHLLQTSGEEAFAKKVSLENNFAYIHEMTYSPLEVWASTNGFSKGELAWIQPSYGYSHCPLPIGIGNFTSGDIHVMEFFPALPTYNMVVGGSFEARTSNNVPIFNIALSNGYNWAPLGGINDIQGTVYAVEYFNGDLYIAGSFILNDTNFHNIAYWDGNDWVGIQTGDMTGTVKTLKSYQCQLYVGGDFLTVNGANTPYLAAWDGTAWNNNPKNCAGTNPASPLSVNGVVNIIDDYKGQLLIGGDFGLAASNSVNKLAVWENGWQTSPLTLGAWGEVKDIVKLHINNQATASHLFLATTILQAYSNGKWYAPNDTIQLQHYENDFITLPFVTDIHNVYSFPSSLKYDKNLYYAAGNDLVDLFERTSFFPHEINQGPSMRYNGPVTAVSCTDDYYTPFYVAGGFTKVMESLSPIVTQCENGLYSGTPGAAITFFPGEGLPLELSEFKVELANKFQVALDWTTLSETGSSHIEIERKTEEQAAYRYVGQVAAAGESFESIQYNFLDDVSDLGATTLYYRLKLVDLDGFFEYSEIRAVKLAERSLQLSISPNPATETVVVQMGVDQNGPATIQLFNVHGQLLRSVEKSATAGSFLAERLEIGDLEAGIYFLKVQTGNKEETRKLVKH